MKRPSPTTRTDYAQSSDSSHYAGNTSKAARKVECTCHFTGKLTLLFADGDKMHPRLRQQLVLDNRPPLNSHELQMFVQEFEADIASRCGLRSIRVGEFRHRIRQRSTRLGKCGAIQTRGKYLSFKRLI